jgi:hypothetical protein
LGFYGLKRNNAVALAVFLLALCVPGCVQDAGGPPPEPPAYLDKLIPGPARISVSWPAVEGAVSYEVWLGETDDRADAVLNRTVAVPFAFITDLDWRKTYWIWVRAKHRNGRLSAFTGPLAETPHQAEIYKAGLYRSPAQSMGGETTKQARK